MFTDAFNERLIANACRHLLAEFLADGVQDQVKGVSSPSAGIEPAVDFIDASSCTHIRKPFHKSRIVFPVDGATLSVEQACQDSFRWQSANPDGYHRHEG